MFLIKKKKYLNRFIKFIMQLIFYCKLGWEKYVRSKAIYVK